MSTNISDGYSHPGDKNAKLRDVKYGSNQAVCPNTRFHNYEHPTQKPGLYNPKEERKKLAQMLANGAQVTLLDASGNWITWAQWLALQT